MILLVKQQSRLLPEIKVYLFGCFVGTWTYTQFAQLISRLQQSQLPADRRMAGEFEKYLKAAIREFEYTSDGKIA